MSNIRWLLIGIALLTGGTASAQLNERAQPSPEMMKRFQQMRNFRDQHKYTFQLRSSIIALGELEKSKRCPLTPLQAKKVMSVITPLKNKRKLTQEEAKKALKDLKVPLSTKQLTEMDKLAGKPGDLRNGSRRPGSPGGGERPFVGGDQRRSSFRGPESHGNRSLFDPSKMKDFNPFSTLKDDNPMARRGAERLQDTISMLEKKAREK